MLCHYIPPITIRKNVDATAMPPVRPKTNALSLLIIKNRIDDIKTSERRKSKDVTYNEIK